MYEFGNRKKLHTHDLNPIRPKNTNQELYLEALFGRFPIVMGLGFAGCGKSLLAISSALHQILDESTPYSKLYVVRNIVESSQSIGWLPGGLEEKTEPYVAPYRAIAQDLLNFNNPWQLLVDLECAEFIIPNFIRGITLEDCIIVVDEAQCIDYQTLKDILTRAGENCKVVINGDVKQDDLAKIGKTSGLAKLCNVLNLLPYGDVAKIDFQISDVVRSGLCRRIIEADYDYEKGESPS